PHDVLTVTADESWTTRELVGGDSVDDQGRLRFAPGYVLQAVEADKWLLIDEANRADLDRIFGGLLTWLSGQEVTVGRLSPTKPAEVVLGWSQSPDSSAPKSLDVDELEPDDRLLFRERHRTADQLLVSTLRWVLDTLAVVARDAATLDE